MQQPETHDHQWWLDVSVVRPVSTSKQTGGDDVFVHQLSTDVSQQGITNEEIKVTLSRKRCRGTLQDYDKGGNDASEHTDETVFSRELSTSVVHGEVA